MIRFGGWWQGISLRGKLMAAILVPTLVVVTGLYTYSRNTLVANFDREYRDRALLVAHIIQKSVTQDDLSDPSGLQAYLQALTSANPGLVRISIYTITAGQPVVMASSDASLLGKNAGPHDIGPLLSGGIVLAEEDEGDESIVEANMPLFVDGKAVATIGVHMSLATRDALVRDQQLNLLLMGGGGLLLLLALVYFLTERLIIFPVAQISRAASQIAEGNLAAELPVLGSDEVGRLSQSFSIMMRELLKDRERLEHLATTDGLTGLCNHRFFHERLREEFNREERHHEPFSLIIIDLDKFKAFNDTYGHLLGDQVLRTIGNILHTSVRPYDVACRYGGEEFVVIVPGVDAELARDVAERIRQRIVAQDFEGANKESTPIRASFGIASYPADGRSPDDLVKAADSALYAAKRAGGNSIRIAAETQADLGKTTS